MYARRYAFLHEEDNIYQAIGIEDNRGDNLYESICAEVYRIDQDTRDVSKSEAFERVLNATVPTNEVEAFWVGYTFAQKVKETNAKKGAPDKKDDPDPPTHFIVFGHRSLIALVLLIALFIIDICVTILL